MPTCWSSVADPDQAFEGHATTGAPKSHPLLGYTRLSVTIVGNHAEVVTFSGQDIGYFCWSNYEIFQGITTVKRFISLIQKTFEAWLKR